MFVLLYANIEELKSNYKYNIATWKYNKADNAERSRNGACRDFTQGNLLPVGWRQSPNS